MIDRGSGSDDEAVVHRPRRASWSSSVCRQRRRQQQAGTVALLATRASPTGHPSWMHLVSPHTVDSPIPPGRCVSRSQLLLYTGLRTISLLRRVSGASEADEMHEEIR